MKCIGFFRQVLRSSIHKRLFAHLEGSTWSKQVYKDMDRKGIKIRGISRIENRNDLIPSC